MVEGAEGDLAQVAALDVVLALVEQDVDEHATHLGRRCERAAVMALAEEAAVAARDAIHGERDAREEELQATCELLLVLALDQEVQVFLPGDSEPLVLSRHAFGLRLLQYVRDEAHRFAQHYHHILRNKSQFE